MDIALPALSQLTLSTFQITLIRIRFKWLDVSVMAQAEDKADCD